MICLVCRPSHLRIEKPINSFQREALADPPDPVRAVEQHQVLIDALVALGVRVVEVPAVSSSPYQVFVRDVLVGGLGDPLLGRMREAIRQSEVDAVAQTLEGIGVRYERSGAGYLEGGDVVVSGDEIFVGVGDRTDRAAVEWLRVRYADRKVHALEMLPGFLHLDMVFNVLSPERCVYCPEALAPSSVEKIRAGFADRLEIGLEDQRRMSSNFLSIAGQAAIVPASAIEGVSDAAWAAGRSVTAVDLGEIQKAGGSVRCATCLIEPS